MTDWPGMFFVGTGRCGSSLLRRTFREHRDAYLPQETHWIPILYDFFGRVPISTETFFDAIRRVYMAKGKTAYQRIQKDGGLSAGEIEAAVRERVGPRDADLAELMTAFYASLAARHDAYAWGDKTPDYGQCMGLLHSLWPDARFVHVTRDGRDVALSMSKVRSFRFQVAWRVCYWPTIAWDKAYAAREDAVDGDLPLDDFFELWRRRIVRIRDEATRLPAGRYLELDYDELLRDPKPALARVCSHVGLDAHDEWIDAATAEFDAGNTGKNRGRPEFVAMTEKHAATLAALGFPA